MSNMRLIDQQDSQRNALRTIQDLYIMGTPGVIFLDAPAGSGKTFLLQTLLHMIRADGEVALAVSSTGITALHCEGGSTLHSKLKAPLDLTPESRLNIKTIPSRPWLPLFASQSCSSGRSRSCITPTCSLPWMEALGTFATARTLRLVGC